MTLEHSTFKQNTMTWLNYRGYLRQHVLLFAAWIVFSCERFGSAKTTYANSRTIDDLDDIFKILREQHTFASADGSNWSDAVDSWIGNVREDRLEGLVDDRNRPTLTRKSIWNLWNGLRTSTKELVIRKLYPILISESPNTGSWRLHCADAHKLCMEDTNCYWKYANFISSCTEDDMNALSLLRVDESLDNPAHHDRRYSNPNLQTSRGKRSLPNHYNQGRSKNSRRKSVKRDVYAVEKRMRKDVKSGNKHRRKHRRKSMFWMGQNVNFPSHPKLDELLRYFSMRTKSNKCSSKCVSSLIMLNETIYGTLLAHCDCRAKTMPSEYKTWHSAENHVEDGHEYFENWERTCGLNQRIAQSCRPRIFGGVSGVIGCSAARMKCEREPECRNAQGQFLSRCSQVINGLRCTSACRESVERLRNATNRYDTCICDGSEGPTCRQIRSRVIELCDIKFSDEDSQRREELLQENRSSHERQIAELAIKQSRKNKTNHFYFSQRPGTHSKNDRRNSAYGLFAFQPNIFVILLSIFFCSVFNSALMLR